MDCQGLPYKGRWQCEALTERLYGGFFIISHKLLRKIRYKFTKPGCWRGILQPTVRKELLIHESTCPPAAIPQKGGPVHHDPRGADRRCLLDLQEPLGRDLLGAGAAEVLAGGRSAGRRPDLPGAGGPCQLRHRPEPTAPVHPASGAGIGLHGQLRQRHLPWGRVACRCSPTTSTAAGCRWAPAWA